MGFSEPNHGCKKHPYHQEKQGVCPSCLRERLSRLCSASHDLVSRVAPSCSSSLSFSPANYSSATSSTSASPARRQQKQRSHKWNGSEVMGSSSFVVKVGNGLMKSRSMAFVARNADEEGSKKKRGFWSKLLGFKGKKDVLAHSSSMRIIGRVF